MTSFFHSFKTAISGISLPERFTFPFFYEPHPLAIIAAEELQNYLETQKELNHNFGLEKDQQGLIIGKMFGVLVVQYSNDQLGYLAAFSGKLGGVNHHSGFVPPVFDMLTEDGFFRTEEKNLTQLTFDIEFKENEAEYIELKDEFAQLTFDHQKKMNETKIQIKRNKAERKTERDRIIALPASELQNYKMEELRKQSIREQYYLKELVSQFKEESVLLLQSISKKENEITVLKEERKMRSSQLQRRLFESYSFLNQSGRSKSLLEIFDNTDDGRSPSGAGECAAPKLLQFAFNHGLKPIALAEFWWGAPPPSEVRVHGQYYPACRGKCEPILGHMLEGMDVDPNPMLDNPAEGKELEIIFEDEAIILINKPAEFLSVPGRKITDSVYTRIKKSHPLAEGPIIVHRLDMSTSGIMVLAKTLKAYHFLQNQFIKRKVKKRYVAILNGTLAQHTGQIELPLRVDIDDRPRQVVCYEHGKHALTRWEKISEEQNQTKVYFYPETGRTHQLRVHAAHKQGLNCAIKGDDLYGLKGDRLHLHAEQIEFTHPLTLDTITFNAKPPF
jgi:tRNA pseudouridine32 synthase/23S rRNA pseudouridine746 synthase